MRIRIQISIVLAVLFLAFSVHGEQGVTDTEIQIGQAAPLSGVAQAWGKTVDGPKLLFEYINSQGGIHGRKLILNTFDDSYNPAKTMHGVKNLQEGKGIFAWIGGVGTENGMRIKDYLMNRHIPWIGPFSGATAWVDPPDEYLFTIYPLNKFEASIITRYIGEVIKKNKVAIIYQDDLFGQEALVGVKTEITRFPGIELVGEIPVAKQEKNLEPFVVQLRKSNPDIVLLWVNPFTAVKVLHISKVMQFSPTWMAPSPLSDYEYLFTKSRTLISGLISNHYINDADPKISEYRAFWEKNKDKLGIPEFTDILIGSLGYAEIMVEALKNCDANLTREKFIREMEKIQNFHGVIGTVSFVPFKTGDPRCRIGMNKLYISQCDPNGKKRILTDWFDLDSKIVQINPPL